MVIASHAIFGAYGFWLPNDPRGSWSDFVGSWELFRYGPATKTTETRSLASRPHNLERRLAAKTALKRVPVIFSAVQIDLIAQGFANYAARSRPEILACAIMPDHVHLVLARHRLEVESLVVQLKGAATHQLKLANLHPFPDTDPPAKCFARGDWKVFLDTPEDVRRAINYVNQNPIKEGRPAQNWPFVTPYV